MKTSGSGPASHPIDRLTKAFKTSITTTAIRYAKFTDDAVAVIISSGNLIDYCFMSDRISGLRGITWIKKGELIPKRTTTGRFNADPANVEKALHEEGTCHLDNWFDGVPQTEVNEDVIGLGAYGKTLTVLFTDEPLEDEDENDDED